MTVRIDNSGVDKFGEAFPVIFAILVILMLVVIAANFILRTKDDSKEAIRRKVKILEKQSNAAKKTDRSFKAGAIAMGAKVEISTLPGYLPTLAEEALPELKHAAEISASGIPVIEASGHAGGSTDVGDVQHLMPVYTFNTGGVKGGLHQIDFEVTDEEEAYIVTAKMFALAAYGLLKEKAQRSRELVDQYEPVFKNSAEYVEFMEQFDSKEIFE